jgi:hypothetical protein
MIRKDFWLTNNQVRFLRKLEGSISEHIRRAIDEYILKIKREQLKVSTSLSK